MIRSMTGFARAEASGPWGRISWEIRSVNHRYLELQFKMPEDFRTLEGELRALTGARLSRGKVECGLRLIREGAASHSVEVNWERVKEIAGLVERLNAELQGLAPVDPLRLLAFPGVTREQESDLTPLLAAVRSLYEKALADFTAMREAEGQRLLAFLAERCDALDLLATQVRARYPNVKSLWVERLRQRAQEFGTELDPARLEQEMVIALQRLDVEEELSRLASHLVEVRASLERDTPIGRRLDFLMQELNREANTLSSKSQDAEMTRCAVEMKVMIEQMREQVQNIE